MPLRLAILISGRGSNMLALADALAPYEKDHGKIVLVAADNSCAGLELAKERGLDSRHVPYQGRPKATSEAELAALIKDYDVDYILLAGFMRVLSADFVGQFDGRIINIHPSLLPKYKGLNTHQRALAAGDTRHGVSVHLVTAGLDEGPVMAQASIPILAGDDENSLASRLLDVEHELYALVVKGLMTGVLTLDDGKPKWLESIEMRHPLATLTLAR